MKHLFAALALVALFAAIATADFDRKTDDHRTLVAQADPTDTAPAVNPATVPDPPVSWAPEEGAAAEVPDPAEPEPELGSNEDLLAKYEALKEAYAKRREMTSTVAGWAGVVAALAWLLIAGIKRVGAWTDRGKRLLPLVALGLGVIAAVAAEAAGGMALWQAVVIGAGAPLSVFVHELLQGAKGGGSKVVMRGALERIRDGVVDPRTSAAVALDRVDGTAGEDLL